VEAGAEIPDEAVQPMLPVRPFGCRLSEVPVMPDLLP